jgi:antitoxin (DNA-binding transcriptional repressor) of toxin-antitoxin stability system
MEPNAPSSQVVSPVAQGRRITITKHGRPVAMLVPATGRPGRPVEDVIRDILAFRKGRLLNRVSIRTLIEEGRR